MAARMDYTQLRDFLAAGEWRKANEETTLRMLAVAGKEKESLLEPLDIYNFPCEDLRIIDQLWVKYSDGHFGFSVQIRIYLSLGGTVKLDSRVWEAFCDRVGWTRSVSAVWYENITFDKKAPEAHLPIINWWTSNSVYGVVGTLVIRLVGE
jgi:eukaryotic-like serine/threonine-protein kinase